MLPSPHLDARPRAVLPVLAGCHPDPSVCRWGDGFVMVTSSFAYWPGLPVHRSTDLRSWTPAGYVLDRPEVLGQHGFGLTGLDLSDGVWAPTVRAHDGVLYVVFSTARDRRADKTYLCTATDPAGPWSDPLPLDVVGIDPSLYFEDGRCWLTACRDAQAPGATGPGELFLRELDLSTLELVGEEVVLWHGALHGAWAEAPHIFKRAGRYHLIAAEGGTERHHAVTAATAEHLTGPWRTDPRSPLLTHRHLGTGAAVQNVGHADLVDAPDGSSWAVVLGVRPVQGAHVLGREVFLTTVDWQEEGPVIAPGTGTLSAVHGPRRRPTTETDAAGAALGWMHLRGPVDHHRDGGEHRLAPSSEPLTGFGTPAFAGTRQDSHAFTFEARVDPSGLVPESQTGVVALQHQDAFLAVRLVMDRAGGLVLRVLLQQPSGAQVLAEQPLDRDHGQCSEPLQLRLWSDSRSYVADAIIAGEVLELARTSHRVLATEHVGGFLGVLLGITAQAPQGSPTAVFSNVRYVRAAPEPVLELVGSA